MWFGLLMICRLTHSLVEKRHKKLKKEIYDKYRTILGNSTKLGVHFISNKHYEMYLEGCDDDISLPLWLTGIPELRFRLSSLPADEKLLVLNHYRTLTIRSKLDSMKMFAQQSTIERRVELKKIVQKPSTVRFIINYAWNVFVLICQSCWLRKLQTTSKI